MSAARSLNQLLAEAWDEGYERGEADEKMRRKCHDSGGPVGGCDCQVPSNNPYED